MDHRAALKLAAKLVESGADVSIEIRHPAAGEGTVEGLAEGAERGNLKGRPEATLRVASGNAIPTAGLSAELTQEILDATSEAGVAIATSDLVLG